MGVQGKTNSITSLFFSVALQQCLSFCGLDTRDRVSYGEPRLTYRSICHSRLLIKILAPTLVGIIQEPQLSYRRCLSGYSDAQIRALGRWKSDAL